MLHAFDEVLPIRVRVAVVVLNLAPMQVEALPVRRVKIEARIQRFFEQLRQMVGVLFEVGLPQVE